MHPFAHHFAYEFRAGLRDRSQMLMNYLFPLLFFVLIGSLMGKVNPHFVRTEIPAMAVFAMLCSFLLSLPGSFVSAREAGVLRSFRINGVPGWAAMAAPILGNAIHMAFVTAIIGVTARFAFSAPAPDHWGRFALAWFGVLIATAGLGALVGVIATSTRAATLAAQIIYIPSIMLSGMMTAPEVLPRSLGKIALLLPATQAMRVFRGDAGWGWSLAALVTGAVVAFASAAALWEWDPKNTLPASRRLLAATALLPYAATLLM